MTVRFHPSARRNANVGVSHVASLYELFGREVPLQEAERTLRACAQGERPPAVGALMMCCSDEAEFEVGQVFQRDFVRALLPAMHFDDKAPFKTSNLGARYEWGSVRVAEDHFAPAPGASDWKLMVLKLHAHVGADGEGYGKLDRYHSPSTACGALGALLAGATLPFAEELAETFGDRVDELRAIPEENRMLLAAVTQARLQARRAMLDVQDHTPATPTMTWILPSVSFNRRGHDTEMMVGMYVCDQRGDEEHSEYCGLGDRPSKYVVTRDGGGVRVSDGELGQPREARCHRQLVRQLVDGEVDPKMADAIGKAKGAETAKAGLEMLIAGAASLSPVTAAMALFGEGALSIHHAAKARRLRHEAYGDPVARKMLGEMQGQLATMTEEQAKHLIGLLTEVYGH